MTAGEGIAHAEVSPDDHGPVLHGAQLWVVPNPSGRNAHAPLDTLAAAYREVALAAAIELGVP